MELHAVVEGGEMKTKNLYHELTLTTRKKRGHRELIKERANNKTKKYRVLKEVGKVTVNFGSLTFASLVLGTILKGDYNRFIILLFGSGFALLFITVGIIMLTAGGEE